MRKRKNYTDDEKAALIVRLIAGESPTLISGETGIAASTLCTWVGRDAQRNGLTFLEDEGWENTPPMFSPTTGAGEGDQPGPGHDANGMDASAVHPQLANLPERGRTRAEKMAIALERLMDAEFTTLLKHAEMYGSQEWLAKQTPATIMESTRLLSRNLVAKLDRIVGRGGLSSDDGERERDTDAAE